MLVRVKSRGEGGDIARLTNVRSTYEQLGVELPRAAIGFGQS